jgi:hypothetical protein
MSDTPQSGWTANERVANEVLNICEEPTHWHDRWKRCAALIAAHVEKAEQDTKRLDWFDATFKGSGEPDPRVGGGTIWHVKFPGVHVTTLRAAIDAIR